MTFFHYAWTYRKKLKFMSKVALIIWPHWVIGRPSQRFRFAQSKRLIFIQHQSPNTFVWMNVIKYQSNCFEVEKSPHKRSFTEKSKYEEIISPHLQSTLKVMSTAGQCLFSWGSELCSTAYLHIIIHPLVIVHHVVYYVQEEYVTTNYLGYLQGELHSFCTYQTACYAHFSICPASHRNSAVRVRVVRWRARGVRTPLTGYACSHAADGIW